MKNEVSELKRAMSVICAEELRSRRTWSTGAYTSRTDRAMMPAHSVAIVDAVFEEESVDFMDAAQQSGSVETIEPKSMVESLTSQLAVLEGQCMNLRKLLELAATARR